MTYYYLPRTLHAANTFTFSSQQIALADTLPNFPYYYFPWLVFGVLKRKSINLFSVSCLVGVRYPKYIVCLIFILHKKCLLLVGCWTSDHISLKMMFCVSAFSLINALRTLDRNDLTKISLLKYLDFMHAYVTTPKNISF